MTKPNPIAAFVGTMLQVVPTAVIVVTGTVPPWARWTLATWLALWATVTLVRGTAAAS